jgi:beta-N-acetylhexosaminidase
LFASDTRAAIFSCGGPELSHQERDFFRKAQPFGFILMGRNCENPAQVKKLTQDLRDSLGRDCPILIDQEGGRVQRLKPPHWRQFPPYRDFGELAEKTLEEALETIRFETLQIAEELRAGGINVNCAPVVDVLREETHDVIGDRAFSPRPDLVSRLGLHRSSSISPDMAARRQTVIKLFLKLKRRLKNWRRAIFFPSSRLRRPISRLASGA